METNVLNYNGEAVIIRLSRYGENDNLYVGLISIDEDGYEEPYTDITVNLSVPLPSYQAYIKTYLGNEGILSFLLDNGFGKVIPGGESVSGYCSYPLFQFSRQRLAELSPKGFFSYEAELNAKSKVPVQQLCKYCGQPNGSTDEDVLCKGCHELFGHSFFSEL